MSQKVEHLTAWQVAAIHAQARHVLEQERYWSLTLPDGSATVRGVPVGWDECAANGPLRLIRYTYGNDSCDLAWSVDSGGRARLYGEPPTRRQTSLLDALMGKTIEHEKVHRLSL